MKLDMSIDDFAKKFIQPSMEKERERIKSCKFTKSGNKRSDRLFKKLCKKTKPVAKVIIDSPPRYKGRSLQDMSANDIARQALEALKMVQQ